MSGALLDRPLITRPRRLAGASTGRSVVRTPLRLPRPAPVAPLQPVEPIVLYGDFNCPWSYLAFRRAAVLSAAGLPVDFRAVEHAPRSAHPGADPRGDFTGLHDEMDRVLAQLLPGEQLPYDFAGFVPWTRATIAAYAEGYAADVAGPVRKVLFEAFWMHGIDIGDAKVLRTLLNDELRSGTSPSETVREWGYPVDVTGGPISTAAWRLARSWAEEWADNGSRTVPIVVVPGEQAYVGVDAVDWLGEQIGVRGLELEPPVVPEPEAPDCRELPSLSWVSANGGDWLRRCARHPGPRGW